MAHLVEQMAYVGDTPWHGLGNPLSPEQPLHVWKHQAGMDWCIKEAPVKYAVKEKTETETGSGTGAKIGTQIGAQTERSKLGFIKNFEDHKVLYRSDTHEALSVVSQRYQVVQPEEVLEFYRDLTEYAGYELQTAGVLKGGRKFWALAKTGQSTTLKRTDTVNGYLLLATSCDGTLATTATPTTVRVVCHNTLSIAINNATGAGTAIKVPHNTVFDSEKVKKQLGIALSHWDGFMYRMKQLSERKVKTHEAMNYFMRVLCEPSGINTGLPYRGNIHLPVQLGTIPTGNASGINSAIPNERALKKVLAMYEGQGRGAELTAAKGTAWGLLSSITEFVDHERRARSTDHRMDSAWFGQGALIKQKALETALQMIA